MLFTTDSLVLNCVIELIPEVDSYIAISSQWSGHSSLTDSARRIIVADLEGTQLTYNTSVTFNTLKSSDSGSYVCSATVSPLSESMDIIGSPPSEETITISVGMLRHVYTQICADFGNGSILNDGVAMCWHISCVFLSCSAARDYWNNIQSSI